MIKYVICSCKYYYMYASVVVSGFLLFLVGEQLITRTLLGVYRGSLTVIAYTAVAGTWQYIVIMSLLKMLLMATVVNLYLKRSVWSHHHQLYLEN